MNEELLNKINELTNEIENLSNDYKNKITEKENELNQLKNKLNQFVSEMETKINDVDEKEKVYVSLIDDYSLYLRNNKIRLEHTDIDLKNIENNKDIILKCCNEMKEENKEINNK